MRQKGSWMKNLAGRRDVALFALVALLPLLAWGRAGANEIPARMAVWDTGRASPDALSQQVVAKRDGWARIPRGETPAAFDGDAVMTNGRVLAVVRQRDSALELYSVRSEGAVFRARLRLHSVEGEPAVRLGRVALIQSTRSAASLEASYLTRKGDTLSVKFRLKRGEISIEAAAGSGAGRLQVECPGRFAVLPDFFADDILIDARAIRPDTIELPSENFLLQPTANGDAIAMCVFENREQDVKVTLSGVGDRRVIAGSEIHFGKGRKIWVALMEAPGIWHTRDIEPEDARKVLRLDWKMPFMAQWRVDFTRQNELTDSWEMLLPEKEGTGFTKPSWLPSGPQGNSPSRTTSGEIDVDAYQVGGPASERLGADRQRWTTVLGRFQYPCWSDRERRGYLQPLKHKKLCFQGPVLIYPINRLAQTPIDTYTTVDLVRTTLGVGPCQYILDVEGQKQEHVGRATCHVRRLLNEIYETKQQKASRKEIETYLQDGLDFVTHIRDRIDRYVEFGHEVRKYLAEQRTAHPEFVAEMENIAKELEDRMAARRERMKTPAFVVQLNEDFRKNLMEYEGPDAMKKLKKYTDALTRIGGSQDGLVGECRWIVRTLRQRAGILMAVDPRCAAIAEEIRARTREVLLKPAAYEGARH